MWVEHRLFITWVYLAIYAFPHFAFAAGMRSWHSYNGAWWFVLTYKILIVFSPMIAKAVQCVPSQLIFLGSGFVYFISYLLRFVNVVEISNAALAWCYTQVCLLGTSQFPFVLGMQFQKH